MKKEFPVKGWKWPFYILGWLPATSLLFWLIHYICYLGQEKDNGFFNKAFHNRVVKFGIYESVVIMLFIIYFLWGF